jgi:hypothetical protein
MQLMERFLAQDKKLLKSRGTNTQYIQYLTNMISHDTLLILGKGEIIIDTSALKLKKPSAISASYEHHDEEIDNIISTQTGFLLNAGSLFRNGTSYPYPKVRVYYVEDTGDRFFSPVILIGAFTPFYTDEQKLKSEILAIAKAYSGGQNHSSAFGQIVAYLSVEYATPIDENLQAWLADNNLIK